MAMACSRCRPAFEDFAPVRFQPRKERGVAEQTVFDDLRIAGAKFPRRQGIERGGVGDHQNRLMEGADEIFAVGGIDGGLAADRGIDLSQQRGRHLHVVEPAPHDRGNEAGEVADDAAAKRQNKIAALDTRRDHLLARLLEYAEALCAFTGWNDHPARRDGTAGKRSFERVERNASDIVVSHDRDFSSRTQSRNPRPERRDEFASDHNVIAARAERDTDRCGIGTKGRGHAPDFSCVKADGARTRRAP